MSHLAALVLSLALVLTANSSLAGGADIGGGLGLVCFESQRAADHIFHQQGRINDDLINEITSVIPIDLISAQEMSNNSSDFWLLKSHENKEELFHRLIQVLHQALPEVAEKIVEIKSQLQEIQLDHSLELMTDAELPDDWIFPANCTLTTLALQDRENIYYDSRLYQKLSPLGKASLQMHEYLYFYGRSRGHQNSLPTRTILTHLLQEGVDAELLKELLIEQDFFNRIESKNRRGDTLGR